MMSARKELFILFFFFLFSAVEFENSLIGVVDFWNVKASKVALNSLHLKSEE